MRPFVTIPDGGFPAVTGCDEVGRGALAGPVVVAAVWFDPVWMHRSLIKELDDSKRLSMNQRLRMDKLLRESPARISIAASSSACIDSRRIRMATLDAMRCAIRKLGMHAPVRIDGIDIPAGLDGDVQAIVRGEAVFPQIAAASIISKVFRDRLMTRLALRYARYGWDQNFGYGTARHLQALREHGATRHHRKLFSPVMNS